MITSTARSRPALFDCESSKSTHIFSGWSADVLVRTITQIGHVVVP